jgi:DNA-binding response OmpR family regulator/DNA-binding CsgD family transcriptional regulator
MPEKVKASLKVRETPQACDPKYSDWDQQAVSQKRTQILLVVDDDEENIRIFEDNLESDYKIMVAANGSQALELAVSMNPDLILLSTAMPGMDSYEVCARLRAISDTCDIPVIFVTDRGREMDAPEGPHLGTVDFITKPLRMPIVKARIQMALRLKNEMEGRIRLTENLAGVNQALKAILDHRELEKKSIEHSMVVNLKRYVFPYLDMLDRLRIGHDLKSCVNIIRTNIEQLIAPVSKRLSSLYLDLTPTEIKVADLIRQNKRTKFIAEKLNASPSTVEKHRYKIRKKLNILNKKVNLAAYLNSLC